MSTLIVRGAKEADDLKAFGSLMALRYQNAHNVIFVDEQGRGRYIKGDDGTLSTDVTLFDAKPFSAELVAMTKEIEEAYSASHPDTAYLSHAYVGAWLFYGVAVEGAVTVMDAVERSDVASLRQSVRLFIASDFGQKPIPWDTLGDDDDAGQDVADGAPG